jgi:hypothetical protein
MKLDLKLLLAKAKDFFFQREYLILVVLFVFFWGTISLVVNLPLFSVGGLTEGRPAPSTIKAPQDIQYVDEEKTEELKEKAREQVEDVYRFSAIAITRAEQNIRNFFDLVEQAKKIKSQETTKTKEAARVSQLNYLRTELNGSISDEVLKAALKLSSTRRKRVEEKAVSLVTSVMSDRIKQAELSEKQEELKELAQSLSAFTAQEKLIMAEVGAAYLEPNYLYDARETQRLKDEVASKVAPYEVKKLKGEVIVREGEIITPEKKDVLQRVGLWRGGLDLRTTIASTLLVAVLLAALGIFIFFEFPNLLKKRRYLVLLGLLLLSAVILTKFLSPFYPPYLIPLPAVAMLISILLGAQLAWPVLVVSIFLTALIIGSQVAFFLTVFLVGVLGIHLVAGLKRQSELIRAGVMVSLFAGFLTLFSHSLLSPSIKDVLMQAGWSTMGGAISAVVTIGLLPFLETAFSITTNLKLVELANPNHPLLQELTIKAPGTYNHSVMVANLAERAAQAVGANPVLARVGAYYHDIGKLKRPAFFIENQAGENPHDKTNPSLSHLIITSHVKDGVEMAKKHGLPHEIVDIVQEHHGTSVLSYFYEKAVLGENKKAVQKEDFRYSGRRPHTREAAIIMLADAVEATARTLSKPSPARLEQMIRQVIKEKLEDGQLDNSHLTLGDLEKIILEFKEVLISAYHARVEYPPLKLAKKGERGADTR